MLRIASIGECMIELSESASAQAESAEDAAPGRGRMTRTFGGDTLNTAVYLARSLRGVDSAVHYVTALGDDPFSSEMLAAWQAEGVATDHVFRLAGRLPGLYIIRTDAGGERTFHYWRSAAAARELFRAEQAETLAAGLSGFDLIYFSAVTLGILDGESRARLMALLEGLRHGGCRIAFDSNYRPRLWQSRAEAQEAVSRAAGLAHIALPTFDDEAALFGDADAAATAARLHGLGAGEVVVKCGGAPCLVSREGETQQVPGVTVARPIDTTAAGDSFNAAYLAARLTGAAPHEAAAAGHRLAAKVIGAKGAIIPA